MIYIRTGRGQDGGQAGTGRQRERLMRLIADRGWTFAGEYADVGVQSSAPGRPGYGRLVADASEGKFSVLAVEDLSRLTRDPGELKAWRDRAGEHGLTVVTATSDGDLTAAGWQPGAGPGEGAGHLAAGNDGVPGRKR